MSLPLQWICWEKKNNNKTQRNKNQNQNQPTKQKSTPNQISEDYDTKRDFLQEKWVHACMGMWISHLYSYLFDIKVSF